MFPQAFLPHVAAPTRLTSPEGSHKATGKAPTPTQCCCLLPMGPRGKHVQSKPLPHRPLPIISLLSLPAFPFPAPSSSLHPPLPHLKDHPTCKKAASSFTHGRLAGPPTPQIDTCQVQAFSYAVSSGALFCTLCPSSFWKLPSLGSRGPRILRPSQGPFLSPIAPPPPSILSLLVALPLTLFEIFSLLPWPV